MSGMFFLVIALGYLMTSPLALLASNSIQRQTLVMLGLLMVVAGLYVGDYAKINNVYYRIV